MPSEVWSANPKIPHQSLESLKETYKERLDAILDKQLTVENIEIFADEALSETVQLRDEILKEYSRNPNFHARPTTLNIQEQENDAFAILGLPDIQDILQSIIDVKGKIDALKIHIHTNVEKVDTVITPPQPNYSTEVKEGKGGFQKRLFPRLLTLLYILEHDFDLTPADVKITQGAVTPEMMRQTPYMRVEIPDMERAVYICDEEGNVSYIFDTKKLAEQGLTSEEIDVDDKRDKDSLIDYYPGIGIRIIQSPHWRSIVAMRLGEPIPKIQTEIQDEHEKKKERKKILEFGEKREWLPFEDFQTEVRSLYPGRNYVSDVSVWYNQEQKKHPNWPSSPYVIYKGIGWQNWPKLVGVENRFLLFADFQAEVRNFYPGKGDVQEWYHGEQKKHPNWHSAPDKKYEDKGWQGWSELVGKENHLKKEYLSFISFQADVRNFYSGQRDVWEWFRQEYKKHPNWPSMPERIYKNKGWQGFPELVGIKNRLKKNK